MTWEFRRAMRPERTLVVREPGAERRGFTPHVERYPGADVATFNPLSGQLDEQTCRTFLDGLDVVYLVETPYDPRFYGWARDARCVTVLHVMPEFWRGHEPGAERPDVWWLPTSWRAEQLPDECRVVEVPVPCVERAHVEPASTTFVHVAGRRAVGDRNGTLLLYQALRRMRSTCAVRIVTQDERLPIVRSRSNIDLQLVTGGLTDRWALYDAADVLVLPRRYGGLCLPALEAIACGLGLVMSGVEPQRSTWPIMPAWCDRGRTIAMPCGDLVLNDTSPSKLAVLLDQLVDDDATVSALRAASRDFARAHSWPMLSSLYRQELTRALVTRGRR